ncbi:hypothetical protein ACET3Z_012213 [Daucus carota]
MDGTSRGKSILEDYANLSINDDDDEGLILEEPSGGEAGPDYTHCLVGRLLTTRRVNFMAMQETLSSIWRPVKEDKDVRKYDNSLRAQVQRQATNSTNQWLRSPDGSLVNPVEERESPMGSQMDGMRRDDNPINSGMQVVTVPQNSENRMAYPMNSGTGENSNGRSGVTNDKEIIDKEDGRRVRRVPRSTLNHFQVVILEDG